MLAGLTRRQFLRRAAAGMAAGALAPAILRGAAPSERVNIACVGVGGRGRLHLRDAARFGNVVALCDIDEQNLSSAARELSGAKTYVDYRKMLEERREIDAVVVATPDHTHAVIGMQAMRMGKHVFIEKPLTHSIGEARALTAAARAHKVATQMGNQGHSSEGYRVLCEFIWAGAIGNVREVHCYTDRPLWQQGMDRPGDTPACPGHLHWDLWLGPAPHRPYHPEYLPFKWRAWWDFGTGALGDMGCHIMDGAVWALKLGAPTRVSIVESSGHNRETAPSRTVLRYDFPAREELPPVSLFWYDGKRMPPRPAELESDRQLPENGSIFIGDKGTMITGCYGEGTRIIPEIKMQEYLKQRPAESIPRVRSHFGDWISACRGGAAASANFEYSGPFTEIVLLGNLALRANHDIEWDGETMRVTNHPEANAFVHRVYRKGWAL